MANQRIYILNEDMTLAAPGKVSQIAIVGAGVALGYIGNEIKTNVTKHCLGGIVKSMKWL